MHCIQLHHLVYHRDKILIHAAIIESQVVVAVDLMIHEPLALTESHSLHFKIY